MACVYGGASAAPQLRQLANAPAVVVATPGRLAELLNMGLVKLNGCTAVVLDEADRMLDMGFKPQVKP